MGMNLSERKQINEALYQAIFEAINQSQELIKSTFYELGYITKIDTEDNGYSVYINSQTIYEKVPAKAGLSLAVGDIVYIVSPNGNKNDRFIDCKKPILEVK